MNQGSGGHKSNGPKAAETPTEKKLRLYRINRAQLLRNEEFLRRVRARVAGVNVDDYGGAGDASSGGYRVVSAETFDNPIPPKHRPPWSQSSDEQAGDASTPEPGGAGTSEEESRDQPQASTSTSRARDSKLDPRIELEYLEHLGSTSSSFCNATSIGEDFITSLGRRLQSSWSTSRDATNSEQQRIFPWCSAEDLVPSRAPPVEWTSRLYDRGSSTPCPETNSNELVHYMEAQSVPSFRGSIAHENQENQSVLAMHSAPLSLQGGGSYNPLATYPQPLISSQQVAPAPHFAPTPYRDIPMPSRSYGHPNTSPPSALRSPNARDDYNRFQRNFEFMMCGDVSSVMDFTIREQISNLVEPFARLRLPPAQEVATHRPKMKTKGTQASDLSLALSGLFPNQSPAKSTSGATFQKDIPIKGEKIPIDCSNLSTMKERIPTAIAGGEEAAYGFHYTPKEFPALPKPSVESTRQSLINRPSHQNDALEHSTSSLPSPYDQIQINNNGDITFIPSTMMQDCYGMVELVKTIRAHNGQGEAMASPQFKFNGEAFSLDHQQHYPLRLAPPVPEFMTIRHWDQLVNIPKVYRLSEYIKKALPKQILTMVTDEAFFFMFYNHCGEITQLEAADHLYVRGWRFHIPLRRWLKPVEGGLWDRWDNYAKSPCYIVFESESWKFVAYTPDGFIDENCLEGRPMVPDSPRL